MPRTSAQATANGGPNGVWTMEAANLFAGPTISNHLILRDVKLPSLTNIYLDWHPGGAPFGIEIDVGVNKLQCTFTLLGVTPQVMNQFRAIAAGNAAVPGANNPGINGTQFYIFGVIRDQINGQAAQAAAYFRGQLGSVEPEDFRRGDIMHTRYSIKGIQHYELSIAGTQIYNWDFMTNAFSTGNYAAIANSSNTAVSTGWTDEQTSTLSGLAAPPMALGGRLQTTSPLINSPLPR